MRVYLSKDGMDSSMIMYPSRATAEKDSPVFPDWDRGWAVKFTSVDDRKLILYGAVEELEIISKQLNELLEKINKAYETKRLKVQLEEDE